jgi:hypothetical protein
MCELYDIIDHFGSSIAMPRAIISGGSSVTSLFINKKNKLYHTQHNKKRQR